MDLGADTGQVFTAHNFDGFAPDGSAPVGLVLTGTAGPEDLTGRNGSDTIAGLDGHGQSLRPCRRRRDQRRRR